MSHLLQQSILFILYLFRMILIVNRDISLNSVNQLGFVTVKSCVFLAVRTEFLNIIYMSSGFKGLIL
jgi:hypothetical protein